MAEQKKKAKKEIHNIMRQKIVRKPIRPKAPSAETEAATKNITVLAPATAPSKEFIDIKLRSLQLSSPDEIYPKDSPTQRSLAMKKDYPRTMTLLRWADYAYVWEEYRCNDKASFHVWMMAKLSNQPVYSSASLHYRLPHEVYVYFLRPSSGIVPDVSAPAIFHFSWPRRVLLWYLKPLLALAYFTDKPGDVLYRLMLKLRLPYCIRKYLPVQH